MSKKSMKGLALTVKSLFPAFWQAEAFFVRSSTKVCYLPSVKKCKQWAS